MIVPSADDPKPTPTGIDAVSPFDSAPPRAQGTLADSDPPTSLVRHDRFRELPPGSIVGDTYEVDARLGAGAMGEVYAARHVKLGKRVAIKVIGHRLSEDDAAIERFAMEARALAQIQHPAIVAVDHVGELADGRAYFVMEFLRGETLFDRLARGRLPLAEALRVLDQMARGLDAAHGHGITHRDLKPDNVFLVHLPGEPPIVKLVDFGLAKLAADVADVDRRAERTQSGVAIGTPMYMSPEQARGPDVDYRTDVYALGCVAYELVLGEPPFPHARTAPELWAAHLHDAPPLPRSIWPEVPPQLDLVLFAMLAKDPAHRPTLEQVRAVIATVTATQPDRAATMFVDPRRSSPRRWATPIAIALGIGIATGAVLTSRPSPAPSPPTLQQPAVERTPTTPISSPSTPPQPSTTPVESPRTIVPPTPTRTAPPKPIVPKRVVAATMKRESAPIDAGIDATTPPPQQPVNPPLDRDQTINPFSKRKGNP